MTFREDRWYGGATTLPASFKKGDVYTIHSASPAGRSVPLHKLWTIHIADSASGSEATVVLPDARNIPVGGPVFLFAVTGDPGIAVIHFSNAAFTGTRVVSVPSTSTWYLVDNSTKAGHWNTRVQGFLFATPAVRPYIVSFGANALPGGIDSYNYDTDSWLPLLFTG